MKYFLAALVVLAAGCTGGGPRHSGSALPASAPPRCQLGKSFNAGDFTFRYPSCWTASSYPEPSVQTHSLVDLSDQSTHTRCHTDSAGTICRGWPVDQLLTGHVLILWSTGGLPTWTLDRAPGIAIAVGGRASRQAILKPGPCQEIGADETITVTISEPNAADNWIGMTACLRGPGEPQTESEIHQMLNSVTFQVS